MNYLSLPFAAFVLLLLILYYLVPKKGRFVVLLCGSLLFYACFDLRYLPFLLFTALTSFFAAKLLERGDRRRLILTLCIALNAAVWFVVKELPWALFTLGRILQRLNSGIPAPQLSLLVPVGISYFILRAIGYVVDVYRGKAAAETSFGKYLLFLSWFPAIVQGPISRYDQLMPQLLHERPCRFETLRDHLVLILFGLVKKMVIADRLGIFVNACFGGYQDLQGVILYGAAVAYSIQLYMDFSGCVDICRGVSGLFGVELIPNFQRPYLARSVKEFWGRWHMSLSGWLKDYVYIPLGGNRKGTGRKYVNLLLTFLVSGLWHGAGFNFFVWGTLHAVYQIVGACTEELRSRCKRALGIRPGSRIDGVWRALVTFHLVAFAWIIFRAGGLMSGVGYVVNMFSSLSLGTLLDGTLQAMGMPYRWIAFLILHVLAVLAAEIRFEKTEDALQWLVSRRLPLRWAICLLLIFDVLLFGVYGSGYSVAGFMYGGF